MRTPIASTSLSFLFLELLIDGTFSFATPFCACLINKHSNALHFILEPGSEIFLQMFNSRPGIKIISKIQEKTIIKLEKFAFEVKEKRVVFLGEEKLPFYAEAQNLLKIAGYKNLATKLEPATIGEGGSLVECQGENCLLLKPKKIELFYEYKPRHWKRVDSSK